MSKSDVRVLSALVFILAGCATASTRPNATTPASEPDYDAIPSVPYSPKLDSTRSVTTWAEELIGYPGVHIVGRNDHGVPIRVTKLVVTLCDNIRGGCIEKPLDIVLRPGERRFLYSIVPAVPSQRYQYQYTASAHRDDGVIPGVPTDMRGWVVSGSDSSEMVTTGSCRRDRPTSQTGVCDSTPASVVNARLSERRLRVRPGAEFVIHYRTRPMAGVVELKMDGEQFRHRFPTDDLTWHAPEEPGVYRFRIDAAWSDKSTARAVFLVEVR